MCASNKNRFPLILFSTLSYVIGLVPSLSIVWISNSLGITISKLISLDSPSPLLFTFIISAVCFALNNGDEITIS